MIIDFKCNDIWYDTLIRFLTLNDTDLPEELKYQACMVRRSKPILFERKWFLEYSIEYVFSLWTYGCESK